MTESSEAHHIINAARAKADKRAAEYVQPDYEAANRIFRQQKAALTRAVNSGNRDKIVLACRKAVHEWRQPPFNGAWPDDWSRWQRALDDALGFRSTVLLEDL